ncbi:MAG TPA: hypothetical protein VD907_04605 [Verrucomicrobiae bacterium]|nr:hypothetical protein [Verrucomicrobiae bacterium]
MQLCTVARVWADGEKWYVLLNLPPLGSSVSEQMAALLGDTPHSIRCTVRSNNQFVVELHPGAAESSEQAHDRGEALCVYATTLIATNYLK